MSTSFLSKLINNSRYQLIKKLNLNNKGSFMFSNINKDVEPVHMAYTAYEAISPQSQKDIPILILHGILGSKVNWNSMSRQIALRTTRNVLALDARNHGDSPHTKEFSYDHMVADLKHLMQELEIQEASLIGHSLGGRAMMAFALKYPHLVQDLVVVDISPISMSDSVRHLPKVLQAMKDIKLSSSNTLMLKAREEADSQLKSRINNQDLRNFILMNLGYDEKQNRFYWKVNIQAILDKLPQFINFPYDGVFDKPTIFIAGSLSDYMKKEEEPLILKKFPKAKFYYIENAGHLVHAEKPEQFLQIVSSFLEEKAELTAVS